MTNSGKLYLIPTVIAEGTEARVIPVEVLETVRNLKYFLAEDIRTARRYLSRLKVFDSIETLRFEILNKDTAAGDLPALMKPLLEGHDVGVISESGCPGIADPGGQAVQFAHQENIQVIPLVGPSSILLALMSSGLNGQHFAFHGYLPIEGKDTARAVQDLERESEQKNQTQLFIETPYRNNGLLQTLLSYLHPDTVLCVAVNLTSPSERIISRPVREWNQQKIELPKAPAIFLFLAQRTNSKKRTSNR